MARSLSVDSEGSEGIGAIHLSPQGKAAVHDRKRIPDSDEEADSQDGPSQPKLSATRNESPRRLTRGRVSAPAAPTVPLSGRTLRPRKPTVAAAPYQVLAYVRPPVLSPSAKARYVTLGDIPPVPAHSFTGNATNPIRALEASPGADFQVSPPTAHLPAKAVKRSTQRQRSPGGNKRRRPFKRLKPTRDRRPKVPDPDDAEDEADTEEEADMVADLEMDEPERFKSASRLRKRQETAYQRKLRKLKNQRLGIVQSSSSSEEGDDDSDESDASTTESDGFVTSDGESLDDTILPAQFSFNAAQTPEFKFKVVFQYFVALVVRGPKSLPLKGEDAKYFLPQLQDLRLRMSGFKSSVRSQIWKMDLVRALETFPHFQTSPLSEIASYCDACNRHNQRCRTCVTLTGNPYDKDTHEALSDSDSESQSESDSETVEQYNMGPHCRERAERFHQLSHWEDILYHRVRRHYRDLLRAKHKPVPDDSEASTSSSPDSDSDPEDRSRRIKVRQQRRARTHQRIEKLRAVGRLPDEYRDIDRVTEWMDNMGYQRKYFRWLKDLEDLSTLGNTAMD